MHLPGRKRLEVFQDAAPAVPSLALTLTEDALPGVEGGVCSVPLWV